MRLRSCVWGTAFGSLIACSSGGDGSSENKDTGMGSGPTELTYTGVSSIFMGASNEYFELDADCSEEGQFAFDTSSARSYVIQNGKLYLLSGSRCQARVLHGTSSTLQGTWTFQGEYEDMPGLGPQDPQSCDAASVTDKNTSGTMEFTNTEIRYNMKIKDFCWGQLSAYVSEDLVDTMTMVTCDSMMWRQNGKVATLKLLEFRVEQAGNPTKFRFDYQGVSCTRQKAFYLMPSPETCTQAYQLYQSAGSQSQGFYYWSYPEVYKIDQADQDAYNACVESSGFTITGYEPGQ